MSPVYSVLWSLGALIIVSWFQKMNRMKLSQIITALYNGSRGILLMAVACGTAGIIIGVLIATGLGVRFAAIVLQSAGNNIYLIAFFTMILSILLGMDMPTAPSYIIASAVAAPILVKLGVPIFAAHLFCFYFAVFSTLTPPVALSTFTAAGIANSPVLPVAVNALKLASVAFIIPYAFIFSPSLLLIGEFGQILLSIFITFVGVICLSLALQYPKLYIIQRILFITTALCLILEGISLISVALFTFSLGILFQVIRLIRSGKQKSNSKRRSLL
jgi:TRAP-type uncharacterized transport system fused permease subunit